MPWNPKALKAARERRGLTQHELADRAGTHQVHIARLETGVREPGIDMLERLAGALRVGVTTLLRPVRTKTAKKPGRSARKASVL